METCVLITLAHAYAPPNVLRFSCRRGARHGMASKPPISRAEGGQLQAPVGPHGIGVRASELLTSSSLLNYIRSTGNWISVSGSP
jgi:hypothetical protein